MLISSRENANVKLFQKLVSSKKARNEHNMFPLEGLRLIEDAILENLELHFIFVAEKSAEKYSEALDLLEKSGYDDKIFTITHDVEQKICDTVTPQGIYAVCKKLDKFFYADKILSDGKYIILNNIQDPGNIGTIIRTADALGIDGVILTGGCCDIYNPKVVRSTMGSMFRMNILECDEISTVLSAFDEKKITTFAAIIDTDAMSLTECDFTVGCGVVIGNEGNGLEQQVINLCKTRMTIKMNGNINSINAAMAAGIIMWEMLRQ